MYERGWANPRGGGYNNEPLYSGPLAQRTPGINIPLRIGLNMGGDRAMLRDERMQKNMAALDSFNSNQSNWAWNAPWDNQGGPLQFG